MDSLTHYFPQCLHLLFILLYAAHTMGLRAMPASTPTLLASGSLNRSQIGLLSSSWRLSLALFKVPASFLIDTLRPSQVLVVTSLCTGICHALFGYLDSYYTMLVVWMCDAAFVSFMWPAAVKQLRQWCTGSGLGFLLNIQSTANGLVATLGPALLLHISSQLASVFQSVEKWRFIFLVPGLVSIAISGLFFLLLLGDARAKSNPLRVNGPPVASEPTSQQLTIVARLYLVLHTPSFYLFVMCNALGHVTKIVMTDWIVVIAMDTKQAGETEAQSAAKWFDVGMMLGVFVSGLLADVITNWIKKLQHANRKDQQPISPNDPGPHNQHARTPVVSLKSFRHSALSSSTCAFTVGTVWALQNVTAELESGSEALDDLAFLLGVGGFFLGGALGLFGVSLLESWPVEFLGTVVGLNGLGAQCGALLSGWPVAYLVSASGGWTPVFLCLKVTATLTIALAVSAFWVTAKS